MSYDDVVKKCNEDQGGSVAFFNETEKDFVFNLLLTQESTFIGINYNDTLKNFTWLDGSLVNTEMFNSFTPSERQDFQYTLLVKPDNNGTYSSVVAFPSSVSNSGLCKTKYFQDCTYSITNSSCELVDNTTYEVNITVTLEIEPELENDPNSCNVSFENSFHEDLSITKLNSTHCRAQDEVRPCEKFTYVFQSNCTIPGPETTTTKHGLKLTSKTIVSFMIPLLAASIIML